MIVTDFQQSHKFTRESEDSHMHWREKAFQECIGISLSPLLLLIITRQDSYLLKNPGSAILKICVPLGKLPYHPNATGKNEWECKGTPWMANSLTPISGVFYVEVHLGSLGWWWLFDSSGWSTGAHGLGQKLPPIKEDHLFLWRRERQKRQAMLSTEIWKSSWFLLDPSGVASWRSWNFQS